MKPGNPFNNPERHQASTDSDETNESPDTKQEATTGEELREFFEKRCAVWETFVQEENFAVEVDESLDTFAFSHKDNTVYMPTSFLEGVELTDGGKAFASYHELAHLAQLFQDPDAYKESFDIPDKKVEEFDDPRLRRLYRDFFNKMFDIHDNSIVVKRNRTFKSGQPEGDTPRRLYKEHLCADRDFTGQSLAAQFSNYLLRKAMIPDEDITVDEPVREALNQEVQMYGQTYESLKQYALEKLSNPRQNIRDIMNIIKADILPVFDQLVETDLDKNNPLDPIEGSSQKGGDESKASEGQEDSESGQEDDGEKEQEEAEEEAGGDGEENTEGEKDQSGDKEGEGDEEGTGEEEEEGAGEGAEEGDEDSDTNQPAASAGRSGPSESKDWDIDDGLTEEAIKDIIEEYEKSQKKGKDIEDTQREWARGAGFSEEETNTMLEIKKSTEEVAKRMRDLWRQFIQKSFEIERKKQARFKSGSTVDPGRLSAELPKILGGDPSEARIFSRYTAEQKETVYKPKRITLDLVIDLSGSMHSGSGEKMRSTQEAVYSLLESLVSFYNKERQNFPSDKEFPVSIDYRALGFGSEVRELTDRTDRERESRQKDAQKKDLKEEIWRAVLRMQENDLGGTEDAPALRMIADDIDEETERDLENEEEIKVVLEITDGETTTPDTTSSFISDLNDVANVYCRGIQIPGSYVASEEEGAESDDPQKPPEIKEPSGTFEAVWGNDWGKKLEDISALKETVQAVLHDALEDKVS